MNDEVLTIKLTESEINLITLLLEQAGTMEDENGQPAFELLHDIMEQTARHDDDWNIDIEPTEIAEDDFINAGILAREMKKSDNPQSFGEFDLGTSKAADRRAERMMQGTASPIANDPIDW